MSHTSENSSFFVIKTPFKDKAFVAGNVLYNLCTLIQRILIKEQNHQWRDVLLLHICKILAPNLLG